MSLFRSAAREALGRIGVPEALLRRRLRRDGNRLILLFHRVLPDEKGTDFSPPGMVVSLRVFREILDWLSGRFDLPAPEEFLAGHPAPLPRPAALITFDDGWSDTVRRAMPEMRHRGIPGICFVSVRHVEEGRLFWPERLIAAMKSVGPGEFLRRTGERASAPGDPDSLERLLGRWKRKSEEEREKLLARIVEGGGEAHEKRRVADWSDLRQLAEGGIVIGSHGVNHRILTRVSPETAARELAESRERITAALGRPPDYVAYPNGDRNEAVRRLAAGAGYRFGFSLDGRMEDPYDLPRVNLHDGKATDRRGRWSARRLRWAIGIA
ncbi:MAG: polysaccharide deacetylase family protein [Candidatus Eisenbacteria bacterium]|nr:polysaccharide deacetylase family protein [Candidatus Eisenbacteria bacterium]